MVRIFKKLFEAYGRQHIPKGYDQSSGKAFCGIKLTMQHLIYIPMAQDKITWMLKNRVCKKCIVYAKLEKTHKWK
jgi:hypothetical protein